jgi:hypothetical protein
LRQPQESQAATAAMTTIEGTSMSIAIRREMYVLVTAITTRTATKDLDKCFIGRGGRSLKEPKS